MQSAKMTIARSPDKAEAGRAAARRFALADLATTGRLAAALAAIVRAGDTIALHGDLGAGKTAFARAFVQALQSAEVRPVEEVPSPTFTLVQTYEFDRFVVWHFDLYRLSTPEEAVELGIDEAAEGVALIEWPDRLGPLLPPSRLDLHLSFGDDDTRIATLDGSPEWTERLASLEAV